ncbi:MULTISPECIES: PepSY-associated TM helix domain-containing protein [Sulfurimonas]|uniref:PepSY-associated TM helix domain-containing protein n=1 Tax=Sulfurimonas TaxID=202746 RepID=UPI0012652521|nr:PepSY-associated TM helix domain-containing protein [Sulfurimonas indica]
MVKSYKLHKFFGLSAGLVVLILSVTGFFLDHDNWNFLYTTTIKHYPDSLNDVDKRLFTSYNVDSQNHEHILVGSKRGLYESYDGGKTFQNILALQINAIKKADNDKIFLATSEGIYTINNDKIQAYMLGGKYINAMSIWGNTLAAVEDKTTIYLIDIKNKRIEQNLHVYLPKNALREDIKLSRFVRDLHYGRGLFDGDISLYINDFGAIVLTLLGVSGFFIWYFIYKKRAAKSSRKWIKYHANIVTIMSAVPVLILLVTGIFLDHGEGLGEFMKRTAIPHAVLPPVYDSLEHDIWSIDYDGKNLRIGNRYGVYKSDDLKHWSLESRGFGYSLTRDGNLLYVGGMGAANRVYDKEWKLLPNTPHMFKDIVKEDDKKVFFSAHMTDLALPKFQDITLYSLLLTLHDGTFFASWWVWINDYAAFATLLLFITGILRWWKKKRLTQRA